MGGESWVLKTTTGQEWGVIKRLIIDSKSCQIRYADIIVGDTGHVVRVPWGRFQIDEESLSVNMPDGRVQAAVSPHQAGGGDTVAMDVWP